MCLPEDVRSAAREAASPLRAAGADVKWTRAEHLHLTLAFVGEADESRAGAARAALEAGAAGVPAFEAELGGFGAFPSVEEPKVVWLGLSRGESQACALAAAVRAELSARGVPFDDKPFAAHVTLGRVRRPGGLKPLKAALERKPAAGREFRVEQAVLMESRLSSTGPEYRTLACAQLGTRLQVDNVNLEPGT